MGMSTNVYGFRPPDATWKKMKAIWDSCQDAGVPPPPEVEKFFEFEEPDNAGVKVPLEENKAVKEFTDETSTGFEVDLTKLPKGISVLRFVNSW